MRLKSSPVLRRVGFLAAQGENCVPVTDPPVDHANHVRHFQNFIHKSRSHRWRSAKRLMDAAEVIKHEVECERVTMVLELLAEGIRQPRETAH